MGKEVEITIRAWTVFKVLACLVLFYALFLLRDILLIFLTAVVIASAVEAGADWFVRRGLPRILVVVLIYLVGISLLALFFYFLVPPLLSDISDLLTMLPKYIDVQSLGGQSGYVGFQTAFQNFANGVSYSELVTSISKSLTSGGSGLFKTAVTIFGGATSLLLVIVLSFYLSAQKDGVEKFLKLITPEKHEAQIIRLWKRARIMIAKWIQGQALLGIMVGLFVYLGLSLLGIRHALLLAFLSAFLELIPVFGPIFGAVPGIAIGLLDGGLGKGLIVAALYTVIQQFESNLIYPLVVKQVIGVPPLVVILALLIGYQLGGFLGVILAVPLAAIALEAVYEYTKKTVTHEKVELLS